VPTARRQAIEERVFRGLLVRVKRLRIELNREFPDLRFVKRVCLAGKALSDMKIVERRSDGVLVAASLRT
jgi:hypothetical protein